jgi:hypothetical protein
VQGNDRQQAIDRFNRSADSFVFLLSTRAGGVGINLTAADTVIIFDSDWNPQNDIQAQARCHRIGQSKQVSIYRLITRRSFESEMFERASRKLGLEQAVLGSYAFSERGQADKMDAKEMEQLLRQGAYALLEEDESAMKEFCEKDIDEILEERAHVRVVEGVKTDNWLNKKKKAKTRKSLFTGASSAEHADIDVDDPDFWKKVLPDLVTPEMMKSRLENDSLEDNEEAVKAYFKDLQTMVEGMRNLMGKNQLPERERTATIHLLLQVSLRESIFNDAQRAQAEEWQSLFEGSRHRKKTVGMYRDDDSDVDERRQYVCNVVVAVVAVCGIFLTHTFVPFAYYAGNLEEAEAAAGSPKRTTGSRPPRRRAPSVVARSLAAASESATTPCRLARRSGQLRRSAAGQSAQSDEARRPLWSHSCASSTPSGSQRRTSRRQTPWTALLGGHCERGLGSRTRSLTRSVTGTTARRSPAARRLCRWRRPATRPTQARAACSTRSSRALRSRRDRRTSNTSRRSDFLVTR